MMLKLGSPGSTLISCSSTDEHQPRLAGLSDIGAGQGGPGDGERAPDVTCLRGAQRLVIARPVEARPERAGDDEFSAWGTRRFYWAITSAASAATGITVSCWLGTASAATGISVSCWLGTSLRAAQNL